MADWKLNRLIVIAFIWVANTYVSAQDSIRIYADTLSMHEQMRVADDRWLLDLVAAQGERLYERDSLQRDTLIMQLTMRKMQLQEQYQRVLDSLLMLQELQMARVVPEDTIPLPDPLQVKMDSLSKVVMRKDLHNAISLSPREIDNIQDDMEELRAEIKSQQTHWYKEGKISVQFTQNYATPNWYSGSSPLNIALLSTFKGRINYAYQKISFENYFDWRAGLSTTPSDSLRKYNVTDDLVRIYSKFGYQIVKKLYASTSVDFQTTLWNVWKPNEHVLQSAFLTPIYLNYNIGFDYRPINGMSITFSPANYRLVYAYYAAREGVNVTSYGISAGKRLLQEFGSSVRLHWKYKIIREIQLDTEFYIYTNYRGIELDWEINLDFAINRFISAQLMLRPRFDTIKYPAGERPKMQFKDVLSIGFAHKFY